MSHRYDSGCECEDCTLFEIQLQEEILQEQAHVERKKARPIVDYLSRYWKRYHK